VERSLPVKGRNSGPSDHSATLKGADSPTPASPRMQWSWRRLFSVIAMLLVQGCQSVTSSPDTRGPEVCTNRGYVEPTQRLEACRPLLERGNADAQTTIGVMYLEGRGVPEDHALAMSSFRKAAAQGHTEAFYNIGYAYEKGKGVRQDFVEAAKWYRRGANRNDVWALGRLAEIYGKGYGVPEDPVKAYMWCAILERHEPRSSQYCVEIKTRMTPEQIDEAMKLASAWKPE
jgi:TPR repeat protein